MTRETNNETLADILEEIRQHIQAVRDYPQDIDITTGDVEDWADRMEAAAKRDAAIHSMTCEANERLREHLAIALESKRKAVWESLAKPRLCKSCKHYLSDGCEICGCGDYEESDTIHPAPAPGNAAAMREALEICLKKMCGGCREAAGRCGYDVPYALYAPRDVAKEHASEVAWDLELITAIDERMREGQKK